MNILKKLSAACLCMTASIIVFSPVASAQDSAGNQCAPQYSSTNTSVICIQSGPSIFWDSSSDSQQLFIRLSDSAPGGQIRWTVQGDQQQVLTLGPGTYNLSSLNIGQPSVLTVRPQAVSQSGFYSYYIGGDSVLGWRISVQYPVAPQPPTEPEPSQPAPEPTREPSRPPVEPAPAPSPSPEPSPSPTPAPSPTPSPDPEPTPSRSTPPSPAPVEPAEPASPPSTRQPQSAPPSVGQPAGPDRLGESAPATDRGRQPMGSPNPTAESSSPAPTPTPDQESAEAPTADTPDEESAAQTAESTSSSEESTAASLDISSDNTIPWGNESETPRTLDRVRSALDPEGGVEGIIEGESDRSVSTDVSGTPSGSRPGGLVTLGVLAAMVLAAGYAIRTSLRNK